MPFRPNFFNADTDTTTISIPLSAATVDTNIFVATRPVRVVAIREAHATAGSDGGAVTLHIRKCTGTQAPSAGTAVHSGTANLKGTANTVQSLSITAGSDSRLSTGDRLAIDVTGTLTALAGGVVTITLRPA
jgi:hypothetical protein